MKAKFGDGEVSLADLAGFDMSNTAAAKFENVPEGIFDFEVCLDPMPDLQQMGEKFAAVIPCKVLNVLALKEPALTPDPTSLIGKVHRETNVLNNDKSLEYLQATFQTLEANTKQGLRAILHSLSGTKFRAAIKHRVDPNDNDKVYASLRKIENVVKPAGSAVAGAVAG